MPKIGGTDLPSWLVVVLIGFGVLIAISQGQLDPAISFGSIGVGMLGKLIVVVGLGLGAFYFLQDISRKR